MAKKIVKKVLKKHQPGGPTGGDYVGKDGLRIMTWPSENKGGKYRLPLKEVIKDIGSNVKKIGSNVKTRVETIKEKIRNRTDSKGKHKGPYWK
jgi:hypothetical protein